MKNTGYVFDNFVKYQCLHNLSSYEHTTKGKFYPSVGIIEINTDYKTFAKEDKNQGYRTWRYAYYHEVLHAYQLYGTSLGALELTVHDMQNALLNHYLEKYRKSSYSSFKEFLTSPDYNPFNILNNENPLLSLIELRTLFGSGYDYFVETDDFYVPRVKDYLQQIYFFVHLYLKSDGFGFKNEEFEKIFTKLYNELIPRAKFPSDFVINARAFDRTTKLIGHPLNYCLLSGEDVWLIPTRAVIEGYAKLIESLAKKTDQDIMDLPSDDVDKIFQVDCSGIYGVTNSLLFSVLGSYMKFGTLEQIHTCFAVYEISLMSRLHPKLLIGSDGLSYRELFVPHRFGAVLFHLANRKKSIYDYCNSIDEIRIGLDAICDELQWMRYSDCLQQLFDDADSYDGYISYHIKSVLSDKIKGHIFPFNRTLRDVLLSKDLIVAFNDTLNISEKYKNNYKQGLEIYELKVISLIKDLFLRYVLYDRDFNEMVNLIDKYLTGLFDKNSIKSRLEKEGLYDLIDFI